MTAHRTWLLWSAAVAVAVYALLWLLYALQWNWLNTLDEWALAPLYDYGSAHDGWVAGWQLFSTVFGPYVFRLVGLVVIVVALLRRKIRLAVFVLISVGLAGLIIHLAKEASDRPRPSTALVFAPSSSFPSGHAMGVTVAVLAFLTVAWPLLRPRARVWVAVGGAVIVVAIGLSRVVLNVHHPSDVVAGWALGYAYFVVCVLVVPPWAPITAVDETPAVPGIAR